MYPVNGGNAGTEQGDPGRLRKAWLEVHSIRWPRAAHGPGDPQFAANLDAMIAEYANHPALAGYFMGDEPGPGAFPQLGAVNQYLLKKDPKRLPFINLLPNYVDEKYIGMKYEKHVEQFCDDRAAATCLLRSLRAVRKSGAGRLFCQHGNNSPQCAQIRCGDGIHFPVHAARHLSRPVGNRLALASEHWAGVWLQGTVVLHVFHTDRCGFEFS